RGRADGTDGDPRHAVACLLIRQAGVERGGADNDWRQRESFMRLLPSSPFILGANLPWVGYGTDIGASAWYPAGGLSSQPASLDLLGATFSTLARDGISLVRTFLLCDLRSGVRFDKRGIRLGL